MAEAGRATGRAETVPTLPSAHVLQLAELVERWGITAEQLLGELGLSRARLSDPAVRLPMADFARLIQRARLLTGEPGLGFHLGLKMRISVHGYVGFAAMTAANLRQAIELACQFGPTRSSALTLRLEERGTEAALVVDETCDLGKARDAIVIAFLVGLWKVGNTITGHELAGSVDFAFAEPDYYGRFESLLPGRARFSRPANRLSFDAATLDLPLLQADPTALRLARDQCERELEELRGRGGLLAQVEALVLQREGGYRTLEELAAEMRISPRTLKRRLKAHGTGYSELLDRARRVEAKRLLGSELSIEQIATRLGYSDAANFTRAFRRWTGQTPGASRGRFDGPR
jgi:AraC-like DNA-binding protein